MQAAWVSFFGADVGPWLPVSATNFQRALTHKVIWGTPQNERNRARTRFIGWRLALNFRGCGGCGASCHRLRESRRRVEILTPLISAIDSHIAIAEGSKCVALTSMYSARIRSSTEMNGDG
jgi:hypothetical protein